MNNVFDAIVVGLGATGSATVWQLAQRGRRVLGLDRFSPPHDYGSTHGESRIIRQALGEGPQYVPLALRSYELWRALESETGTGLLTTTGGLILESQADAGSAGGRRNFFAQTVDCARQFHIRHEILEAPEIRKRYPQFAVTDERGYFEYETGYLRPERCVRAQLDQAARYGASLHTDEKVIAVLSGSGSVTVKTTGAAYIAERLVLAAGPWIHEFLEPAYARFFNVQRQVMYWFRVREPWRADFLPGRFPIFIWIFRRASGFAFYGFPSLDGATVKVATEQYAATTTPEDVDREISRAEIQSMYADYLRDRLPAISESCAAAVSCLYTTTPDANFVIDACPGSAGVIIASPCSGHGFKHAPAIGEAIAQLIIDGKSKVDLGSFGIGRFGA